MQNCSDVVLYGKWIVDGIKKQGINENKFDFYNASKIVDLVKKNVFIKSIGFVLFYKKFLMDQTAEAVLFCFGKSKFFYLTQKS